MTGSIHRRGKKWAAVLTLGYTVDAETGKNKREQKCHKLTIDPLLTKKEQEDAARRQPREMLHQDEHGTYVRPSKLPRSAYLRTWLEQSMTPPMTRPLTYRTYKALVEKHVANAPVGSVLLQQLRGSDLERLYADVKLSPSSVELLHAILHRALRRAVKDKLLQTNPAIDLERPQIAKVGQTAKMHVWSATEARRVLDAAKHA